MVLSSEVRNVLEDMPNITRSLSDISGFDVHSHVVEGHRGQFAASYGSKNDVTDVYLYALEDNKLVETEQMIR